MEAEAKRRQTRVRAVRSPPSSALAPLPPPRFPLRAAHSAKSAIDGSNVRRWTARIPRGPQVQGGRRAGLGRTALRHVRALKTTRRVLGSCDLCFLPPPPTIAMRYDYD
jgi:hypothetical protein